MTAPPTIELELPPAHVATLQHIHRDLATTQDSEAFTQRALDALCALIQPAAAYVLLLHHDRATLSVAAAWPAGAEDRAVSISTDRLRALDTPRAALLEPHEQATLTKQLAGLAAAESDSAAEHPAGARGPAAGRAAAGTAGRPADRAGGHPAGRAGQQRAGGRRLWRAAGRDIDPPQRAADDGGRYRRACLVLARNPRGLPAGRPEAQRIFQGRGRLAAAARRGDRRADLCDDAGGRRGKAVRHAPAARCGRGRLCGANPAGVYHQRCRKRPAALQAAASRAPSL